MSYINSNGTSVINRKNAPQLIEYPEIDKELIATKAFVSKFDDYLTGFAILLSGVSIEEANAAGAY